jgi:hypothetical protein
MDPYIDVAELTEIGRSPEILLLAKTVSFVSPARARSTCQFSFDGPVHFNKTSHSPAGGWLERSYRIESRSF